MNEAHCPAQSPLLMVVDDDEEMREAVALALGARGFRIVEKPNGQAALDYLRQSERPDLILLDLVMPEMDGWEFRGEQLRDAELATIPVVALSADESAKARAVHATAFIQKPVSPPTLFTTIGQILGVRAPLLQGRPTSAAPSLTPARARRPKKINAKSLSIAADLPADAPRHPSTPSRPVRERQLRVHAETQCERQLMLVSGGLAHAVNNSLQCVLAYLESIDVPSGDSALHASTMSSVEHCASTIARLARSAPRTPLQPEPRLRESDIWRIVDVFRARWPAHVELRLANLHALVAADLGPQALHDIMSELVVNSLEALTGGTGVIEMRAGKEDFRAVDLRDARPTKNVRSGNYCYLDVIDNGSGIMPSVLPLIFEPFFSTKFAGRGLGLSIVLARVRQAGGLILASSELGVRTTLRVVLPAR